MSHIFQCKNAFHVNAPKASLRTTVCGLTLIIIIQLLEPAKKVKTFGEGKHYQRGFV